MRKTHLLKLTAILGILVMLISFAVFPDTSPWYYEILLFNVGLWPWLLAMKELKKMKSQIKLKMEKRIKRNWVNITGAILILVGALSVFPENDTWLHTSLQIIFVVGCILFIIGGRLSKRMNNSIIGLVLMTFISFPNDLSAQQDYTEQVEAFEASFNRKDITLIRPFLSDSLKFDPLPIQNTVPVLTNMLTQLPQLNSLQIKHSERGKAFVKYDFEQLGMSESDIYFGTNGKIERIEFVENLIQQQIEQQRKMKLSVQAPQPEKIDFAYSKKETRFPSKDGLIILADLYEVGPKKPVILLCHQAGFSKYEYADIAPRLNKMGYNALAIDQRSGGDNPAGKENETNKRALQNGQGEIAFTDAIKDIEAAIDYLSRTYQQKVIVWGSSYSSALALHLAGKNKNVKAVISFSPGDYFGDKLPSLRTVFPKIEQPFFVTSSKEESQALKELLTKNNQNRNQIQFIPESEGFHGSRALWIGQEGSEEYWVAIKSFLKTVKTY